eukprot:1195583-Prorocentrum_minimum.AAC.4
MTESERNAGRGCFPVRAPSVSPTGSDRNSGSLPGARKVQPKMIKMTEIGNNKRDASGARFPRSR